MHSYEVGTYYGGSEKEWPEQVQYQFRGTEGGAGEHELLFFLGGVTPKEVKAIRKSTCDFAFVVYGPVINFLYRFGDAIRWSDAPYSIHLLPSEEQHPPSMVDEAAARRALLHVLLMDAPTGLIRAQRVVTFSPEFSAALHDAIVAQAASPWDRDVYMRSVSALQATPAEGLVDQAVAKCRGGKS